MITETSMAVRTLTASLLPFLNAIARGPEGGTLELHARSPQGFGYQHLNPPIPRLPWHSLPEFALAPIEQSWSVHVGAAVRNGTGSELVSLAVAFATFPVGVDFNAENGWRHQAAAADRDAALARLDGFPLAPGFIIDGVEEIVALWPLAEPLRDLDRARRQQRRLAETLGASTASVALLIPSTTNVPGHRVEHPADDPAAFLPFPGSIVRSLGDPPPVVTFTDVAPEHVYTSEQFEAALGQEASTT